MRGGWGAAFGPPFIVYRLSPTTPATGILTDTPVIALYNAEFKRLPKTEIEDETFGAIAFEGTCDNTFLQFGDILKETGYRSTGAVYCYAQYRIYGPNVFMRCERTAIVRRPTDVHAPNIGAEPLTQWTAVTGTDAEVTEATAYAAVLTDGTYAFTPAGTAPTPVPYGAQPTTRISGTHPENVPTSTSDQRFSIYLPPMPGITILPNDEIEDQDGTGTVYVAQEVYTSVDTGLYGTVALCTREGA
jgi:hypothetical protein